MICLLSLRGGLTMKALAAFSGVALLLLPVAGSADGANKELQNLLGDVSYTHGVSKSPLANKASIVLADRDIAETGAKSRAGVTLADSSVVTIGSDSKVQMALFNRVTSTAKFVIYNGQTRFAVRHPKGAKANYTFVTPTATIAVRGTEGDIAVTPDELQVNVYEVCNPALPVIVTTKSGEKFTIHAKEALVGQIVDGVIQAQVESLTAELMNRFNQDLGIPRIPSIADLTSEARSQAEGAIENATGNNGITSAIGGLFKKKAPEPAPSSAPETTCS